MASTAATASGDDPAGDRAEAEAARSLVARLRSGDASAEAEIVQRYSRGLAFLLRRHTRDAALADDLHQETFRIVIQRLRGQGIDQPDRLAGFIRRTARNLFIADYRRSVRRRSGTSEALGSFPDPAPSPLRQVLIEEQACSVRRLVGEMRNERDRQILYRFYLTEEDKQRICDSLGLSDLHFNRVLFRARQRLKELIEASSENGPRRG